VTAGITRAAATRGEPVPVGEHEGAWAAEWLDRLDARPDALYFATRSSGSAPAVSFWRESHERSLRLASPRLFPWTLASSPAGQIAIALDIRGPIHVLVGRGDATLAALDQALFDLTDTGSVTSPLVVAFDRLPGARPDARGSQVSCEAGALMLRTSAVGLTLGEISTAKGPSDIPLDQSSAAVLAVGVERLLNGEVTILAGADGVGVRLRPD
jgi:hypothetical protein